MSISSIISDDIAVRAESVPESLDRITVKSQGQTHVVSIADVDWIESDGNYLRLHLGESSHVVRGTISSWAQRLERHGFVRIHRRFLVRADRIGEVQPWFAGDCILTLHNGTKLRLSRTFRGAFQEKVPVPIGARA